MKFLEGSKEHDKRQNRFAKLLDYILVFIYGKLLNYLPLD